MYAKSWFMVVFALATAFSGNTLLAAVTDCERQEGFVSLFDGVSLDGWEVMDSPSWSAQNGMILCSGEGHGWLRTKKEYKDFILRLDYRVADGANSGLFLRATEQGNPAFTGMEVQIFGDHGKPASKTSTASVYDAIAPSRNMSRPGGEWNSFEITIVGNGLAVALNGRTVISTDLYDKALNDTLSEDRKFPNRAKTGYIGLQNHGNKLEFRNIRIKNLTLSNEPENP